MTRLVVLASNRGSNFSAIADAIESKAIPNCEIVALICNNSSAYALEIAKAKKIPFQIIDSKTISNRQVYDRLLHAKVEELRPDFICLAGYMRLLSGEFVDNWKFKIINIHPSLLPAFPGLQAQEQALEYGVRWTGCTVHLVTKEMDAGPILQQTPIEIKDNDNLQTLSERLLSLEHETYVTALSRVVSTPFRVVGRKVVWS